MPSEDHDPWLDDDERFGAPPEPIRKPKPDLGPDWEPEAALDLSGVHLEDPDAWGPRLPSWVIDEPHVDEEIRSIRSGKEADVSLVRRTSDDRSCLLAVKRYRPRAQRSFRREEVYRAGATFGSTRADRAVAKRSGFGRELLEYAWAYREYPVMRRAWETGARVPYPVEEREHGLAMQYLGDDDAPAPRLADVRLDPTVARRAFDAVIESVRCLLDAYVVHADLSVFNILWWEDEPWLIDFPQAVDVANHDEGLSFLRRDIENVCKHFRRWGVDADPTDVVDDVLRTSPIRWAR